MDTNKTLRPVIDPELPPDVREALLSSPASLRPASAEAPPPPRAGGLTSEDAVRAVPVAAVCGFLPVVAAPVLLRTALRPAFAWTVGAAAQLALAAAWWSSGFWTFLLAGTGLQVLCYPAILYFAGREDEPAELARVHHGRYYLDGDFANSGMRNWFGLSLRRLMERTQVAVAVVLESDVHTADLLDDAAHTVTLPRQEWEIAQTLAELTRIGRQLKAAVSTGGAGPRLLDAVRPQQEALKESVAALTRRVEALERYADQIRAADGAYREWRALQALAEIDTDTREVLARTVRDELAVDEIGDLEDQSGLAALRESLRKAREAGSLLTEQV
ncbi:hypothetical protein [Actinomadura gamaensis]|uniref:Uncharacterized protein n=1 Tax=Actinomadura gamaensis TaxID=1763541 RepID=A0ABV9TR96_9ACTN